MRMTETVSLTLVAAAIDPPHAIKERLRMSRPRERGGMRDVIAVAAAIASLGDHEADQSDQSVDAGQGFGRSKEMTGGGVAAPRVSAATTTHLTGDQGRQGDGVLIEQINVIRLDGDGRDLNLARDIVLSRGSERDLAPDHGGEIVHDLSERGRRVRIGRESDLGPKKAVWTALQHTSTRRRKKPGNKTKSKSESARRRHTSLHRRKHARRASLYLASTSRWMTSVASVLNGLPTLDGVLPKTSIAMCRQRESTHTDQIATGTAIRSGTGQKMIGETVVVTLPYVGTPLFPATTAPQLLLVAAVESVSARETGSRTDDAAGPPAAGVGPATERGTTLVTVIETGIGTVIEIAKGTGTGTETVTETEIETGTGIEGGTGIEIGTEQEIAHRAGTVETVVQVDAVSSGIDARTKSSGSQPRTKSSGSRPRTKDSAPSPFRPAALPQLGHGQPS